MSKRFAHRFVLPLAALAMVLTANSGWSCAVCFGDPEAPMTKGAQAGVIFLAGVVYSILMASGSVVVYWMIRARRLEREELSHSIDRPAT